MFKCSNNNKMGLKKIQFIGFRLILLGETSALFLFILGLPPSYFGYRVFITLKEPQKAFVIGFPPIKKTKEILFDVDEPEKFVTAILERVPSLKGD